MKVFLKDASCAKRIIVDHVDMILIMRGELMYIKSSFRYLFWCIPVVIVNIMMFYTAGNSEWEFTVSLLFSSIYVIMLIPSVLDTYRYYKQQQEIIRYGTIYEGVVRQLLAVEYEYSYTRVNTYEKTGYRIDCTVEDCIGNVKHYYSDILPRYLKHKVPNYVKVYSYIGNTYITWDKRFKGVKHSVLKTKEIEYRKGYRLWLCFINELYIMMFLVLVVVQIMDVMGVFNL